MAHDLMEKVKPRRRRILDRLDWANLPAGRLPGLWTEEEYLALDINRRIEFTDGLIEVLTLPTFVHQAIAMLLCMKLDELRIHGKRGRATFSGFKTRVRENKWREPDVLYLRPENEHLHDDRWWTHTDFAVEVVSPDDPGRDYSVKRVEYAEGGIPEYWIVDPRRRTILQLVLDPGSTEYREVGTFGPGDVVRAATLPGFQVDFGALLAEAERR